jgi:hypothetical protein
MSAFRNVHLILNPIELSIGFILNTFKLAWLALPFLGALALGLSLNCSLYGILRIIYGHFTILIIT